MEIFSEFKFNRGEFLWDLTKAFSSGAQIDSFLIDFETLVKQIVKISKKYPDHNPEKRNPERNLCLLFCLTFFSKKNIEFINKLCENVKIKTEQEDD